MVGNDKKEIEEKLIAPMEAKPAQDANAELTGGEAPFRQDANHEDRYTTICHARGA
jgi:hypothetical protein